MNQKISQSTGGFTLTELIVSVSVFLLVVVTVMGGLVRTIGAERTTRIRSAFYNDVYTYLDRLDREVSQARAVGTEYVDGNVVGSSEAGTRLYLMQSDGSYFYYDFESVGSGDGIVSRYSDGQPEALLDPAGASLSAVRFWVGDGTGGSQKVVVVTVRGEINGQDLYAFRYLTPYQFGNTD